MSKLLLLSLSFVLISSFALEMKPEEVPTNNKNFLQKNYNKFIGYLRSRQRI